MGWMWKLSKLKTLPNHCMVISNKQLSIVIQYNIVWRLEQNITRHSFPGFVLFSDPCVTWLLLCFNFPFGSIKYSYFSHCIHTQGVECNHVTHKILINQDYVVVVADFLFVFCFLLLVDKKLINTALNMDIWSSTIPLYSHLALCHLCPEWATDLSHI